ncbi:MAG: hypothetical protein ACWGQW_15485 [bacterium]
MPAGVPDSVLTSAFITPATRSAVKGLSTGVSITAVDSPVTLSLTLRNQDGEPVVDGEATLQLTGYGHIARFIQELFPNADTENFEGTLTVEAQGGTIAGTAIQLGSAPGEFTTLPVIVLR